MERIEVENKLIELIKEVLVDPDARVPRKTVIEVEKTLDQLGLDSLEIIELSFEISDEFSIGRCGFKLKREDTITTITNRILEKLAKKGS